MGAQLNLKLVDDAATDQLGASLAHNLLPGDLVLLEGNLGAGKTSLARSVVRTLMQSPTLDVPSPSFALVQPYQSDKTTILHADLYRLADAREIDELGLLDDPQAIVLVEWAERAPELADKATVTINLEMGTGGNGRIAHIEMRDAARLDSLTNATSALGLD